MKLDVFFNIKSITKYLMTLHNNIMAIILLRNLPYQYPLPKTKQTVFGIHCRLYLHHPKSCRLGPVIDPFLKSVIIMKGFVIFNSNTISDFAN